MKLRLAQSFCFMLLCSSALTAQTTQAIDVELHNVTLAEALKKLENESGTHILFDYKDVESYHVTFHAKDQTLEDIIGIILQEKPLIYTKVREKTYVIQKSDSVQKRLEYTLSGLVTDSLSRPIDAAVVSVINSQTSTSLSQGITSDKGIFKLAAKGNIQLYVSCLGYIPFLTSSFELDQDTTFHIKLQSASILLDDILVIGEKQTPSVRIVNGNTVFFPKNSSTLAGSSALHIPEHTRSLSGSLLGYKTIP